MLSSSQLFAVKFSLGIVAGLLVIAWVAGRQENPRFGAWLDVALGTLIGGMVSARLVYVAFDWSYFSEFPADILRVWHGGYHWHGALMGGLVGAVIMCRWRQVPFAAFSDALALAFPFGLMAGWWACRDVGCGYGLTIDPHTTELPGWTTGFLRDIAGDVALRLELQIAAVLIGVLLLGLATLLTVRDWLPGLRLWLVLYCTGLTMFLLGFFRDDPTEQVFNRRLDQNFDLLVMIFSVLLGAWVYLLRNRPAVNVALPEA